MTEASARPPARSRGVIALVEQNCTVCMLCARECPDWCISITGHTEEVPGPSGRRPRQQNVLDTFAVDYGLCLYCGICVEVCPFDALFWAPEHEYPSGELAALVHDRGRLGSWSAAVPAPPRLDGGAEPAKEEVTASRAGGRRAPSGPPVSGS